MCAASGKKNERNKIVSFYCTQSDILLCGIAKFSWGNKNKLRTFELQKWKNIKNSQPQTKFTGSYRKRVYVNIFQLFCNLPQCLKFFFRLHFHIKLLSNEYVIEITELLIHRQGLPIMLQTRLWKQHEINLECNCIYHF